MNIERSESRSESPKKVVPQRALPTIAHSRTYFQDRLGVDGRCSIRWRVRESRTIYQSAETVATWTISACAHNGMINPHLSPGPPARCRIMMQGLMASSSSKSFDVPYALELQPTEHRPPWERTLSSLVGQLHQGYTG